MTLLNIMDVVYDNYLHPILASCLTKHKCFTYFKPIVDFGLQKASKLLDNLTLAPKRTNMLKVYNDASQ